MIFPSNVPNKAGGDLLGVRELSHRFGVTETTIYNWIKDSKLPRSIKLGNLHKWKSSDIESWLDGGGMDATNTHS